MHCRFWSSADLPIWSTAVRPVHHLPPRGASSAVCQTGGRGRVCPLPLQSLSPYGIMLVFGCPNGVFARGPESALALRPDAWFWSFRESVPPCCGRLFCVQRAVGSADERTRTDARTDGRRPHPEQFLPCDVRRPRAEMGSSSFAQGPKYADSPPDDFDVSPHGARPYSRLKNYGLSHGEMSRVGRFALRRNGHFPRILCARN